MPQPSFYQQRMDLIGVTEENNVIKLFNPEAEAPMPKYSDSKIFTEDQEGNIEILYYDIEGLAIMYHTDAKTPMPRFYKTKRLKEPKGDMKYKMPKGVGTYPWFHPQLVHKFFLKEEIETLFLTEGVFKAWTACQAGMDVIGLSSITHYAGPDRHLHRDIVRLIEVCKVSNVVVLWDGDCLDVSKKDIQVREEATRRPFGFFNAVKKIRKLIQNAQWDKPRAMPRVFFQYVKSNEIDNSPKGLDDLIIAEAARAKKPKEQQEKRSAVVRDALDLMNKGRFFQKFEITTTTDLLFQHFALHDVEKFYARHNHIIGEQEFFFRRDLYHYSETENKLRILAPAWAQNIKWIGDEFYEEILVPSSYGDRRRLEHRKKETLSARYGSDFKQYLQYYHGFVNLPSHFNYERIIEREGGEFYNRYFPFPHLPQSGNWDNILRFVKHIFGEEEVTHPKTGDKYLSWQLGLDYVQLLLLQPTQPLPILVLFSRENQTGKSTFGQLLKNMLGDNAIFIGNSDLQSDFNEIYTDKLLAICEETLLERRKDAERIKNMSTAKELTINPKGQKQYTIDFFTKFQFYSNNPRMVYVTRHDDRYWIIQVPQLPKTDIDPKLPQKMMEEIPAFVHHLRDREMVAKNESRMWFNPELLRTKTFLDTVRINEPTAATDLREHIRDMFYDCGPECEMIEMPLKNIKEEFFTNNTSSTWIQEILRDYMLVDLKRDKEGTAIYERGEYKKLSYDEYGNDGDGTFEMKTVKWKGRPYVFHREKFIVDEVVFNLNGEMAVTESAVTAPVENDDDLPF